MARENPRGGGKISGPPRLGYVSQCRTSWTDLIARVAERFPDCRHSDEAIRLDWKPASGDRVAAAPVVLLRAEVAGVDVLMLLGWIGDESGLAAREALALSGWLQGGGVILRDGVYLFRVVLPIEVLDGERLDAAIEHVATESIAIRELIAPSAVAIEDFSWAL